MKLSVHGPNNMSSFKLKQYFTSILSTEFANCGFNIILGFESSFKTRICTLYFTNSKQIDICVNLGYVKKSIDTIGSSFLFKVYYCAIFIAEYIKQIERAKKSVPQSYFEGLTFLNAIEVCRSNKKVSVYSPLSHWNEKPKRTYCIRPIEISSAINSLNKIRLLTPTKLNAQDIETIRTFCHSLLLYAGLPEVAYVHSNIPVYSMSDSLQRLADIILREPAVVDEFPILAMAPFERIKQLTIGDMFLFCVQSDSKFLMGIAIRLIAFLHMSQDMGLDDSIYRKLVHEINSYVDYSISYCNGLSKLDRCLIKDNLFAIKTAIKSINNYLNICGTGVNAGNIHPIG
nr:hypothetical protein [Anaerofilum sp. An201]